jgi:hypothetical protein
MVISQSYTIGQILMGSAIPITDYRLPITDYRLPITDYPKIGISTTSTREPIKSDWSVGFDRLRARGLLFNFH